MFQVNNLVRVADLTKMLSKGNTTNWSYKLYKIIETFKDTISSFCIDNLSERYKEAFSENTKLSLKENKAVIKAINLN